MARSLLVKTVAGDSFHIDVAEKALMRDVKQKITEDRGVAPTNQVLISAGKTLKDDATLSECVSPSGFLVLMVKGAKPAAPSRSSETLAASATPTSSPAPAASVPSTAAASAAAPAAASAAAPAPASAGSVVADGELPVDAASVGQLTAMGFPEDQARMALRAAFNDVSRAAGYLMEGIPEGAMHDAGDDSGGAGVGGDEEAVVDLGMGAEGEGDDDDDDDGDIGRALAAAAAEAFGSGEGGGGNPLNFLRFHPQFEQLRALVRENPSMLQQVLQQLGNQSPELVERISAHPDDFLRLMNDPPDEEGQAMMDMGVETLLERMEQMEGMDIADGHEGESASEERGGQGSGQAQAGQQVQVTVELTQEENAAVENLMAMVPGVGRDQVIEAFIACDKNAEMAANLLFENAL